MSQRLSHLVIPVKDEYAPNAVDGHRGDETAPFDVDAGRFGEKGKQAFEASNLAIRLNSGQPQAVLGNGAGSNHPELVDHLRNQTGHAAPTPKSVDGISSKAALSVARLGQPAKDVRVHQDVHSPRPT